MFSVRVVNVEEKFKALREIDRGAASEIKKEIRQIAKPTLSTARSYAGGLGSNPTGSYAGSLSLKTNQNGVAWVSNDPGGGVIEFANIGARVLDGPRAGRRAGVPHGSTPPRALLKAVLEDEGAIVRDLDRAVEAYIERLMPLG